MHFVKRTKSASIVVPCDASNATAGLGAVFFIADIITETAILRFFCLTAAFFFSLFFISCSAIFLVVSITPVSAKTTFLGERSSLVLPSSQGSFQCQN